MGIGDTGTLSLILLKLKIVLLADAIFNTTGEPLQLKSSLPVFNLTYCFRISLKIPIYGLWRHHRKNRNKLLQI
jgi:hypothetical protein